MFQKRGVIHESVAAALGDLGVVTEGQQTDPSNNQQFVAEGALGIAGLVTEESQCGSKPKNGDAKDGDAKDGDDKDGDDKPPVEENKDGEDKPPVTENKDEVDETDGEPDSSTQGASTTSSTKVDTKKENTKTEVDVDAGKSKISEEEQAAADEAATAFYEGVDKPVTFVIYEGDEGEDETVEVHGLTNEDLSPFGGVAPIMPAKMKKQAKDGGSNKKGDTGVLMLYSTKGMDAKTKKMLTGQNFRACGWGTPPKGTGKPC